MKTKDEIAILGKLCCAKKSLEVAAAIVRDCYDYEDNSPVANDLKSLYNKIKGLVGECREISSKDWKN